MRQFLIAHLIILCVQDWTWATPPKHESGMVALDEFVRTGPLESGDRIVGMTGFYGQDQPRQWLILVRTGESQNKLFEYVMTEGRLQGRRELRALPQQDLPTVPIPLDRLKVDSDAAFFTTERLAESRGTSYDSVHYQLRSREGSSEPVWMVNLLDPIGKQIGIHYISAESGDVLRSTWNVPASLSQTTGKKSARFLYGGGVEEVTVSGKAERKQRPIREIPQSSATN